MRIYQASKICPDIKSDAYGYATQFAKRLISKPMFPFLLFLTAVASIFVYLRTNNDIFALLAVGTSICCLIWGLVIVHWSIHILALLALLFVGKPVAVATVNSRQR